jgi:L-amino acid N-acyltransferase YncA
MVKFRVADITDAKSVMEIYNEHIANGNSTMDQQPKTLAEIEDWFKGFRERELIVILADGNNVLGWGIIKRYSDREGYAGACETAIYLKSAEIRQGYGTLMKKWIIEKCRELGYHHLVAKIFSSNTASIEYNKKLGYELVGKQKEIGFVNGQWLDVTILQLII